MKRGGEVGTERGALRALGALFALAVLSTAVALWVGKPSWLVAWGLFFGAAAWYVVLTRRAHTLLRDVVIGGWQGAIERPSLLVGRPESVYRLAEAFVAVRKRDTLAADAALSRVVRDDLGPWEQRVYDAVRTLASLEDQDGARAAQLAPLALPTEHPDVDRVLALVMVRAAWDEPARLAAIGRAIERVGPHLADVVAVTRAKLGGRVDDHEAVLAAGVAGELGDGELRQAMLARMAARRGYR